MIYSLDAINTILRLGLFSGQVVHYSGWDSGQPRGTAERGCVAVAEETSFLWFMEACDTPHHFVCQKRM